MKDEVRKCLLSFGMGSFVFQVTIQIYKDITNYNFACYYGCGTWSLALREESMVRVFENRVLKRIFGPMSDEVTGEWGKLHNEELDDLYCSPNIIWVIKSRGMRWAGHVACIGERRGAYMVLVGILDVTRTLGRTRGRWEDNIKMDLQEVGWGTKDWTEVVQNRDKCWETVNAVMNLRVP